MRILQLGLSVTSATSLFCITIAPAFANTVTVQPGQTLWSISQTEHIPLNALEAANPSVTSTNLFVGTVLLLPSTTTDQQSTYVISPGDTLWKIAQHYSLSIKGISAANPTLNPTNLIVGTTINIPANNTGLTQNKTNQTLANSDQQNLYWMEHAIHAEAEGEPLDAQIAVGDVILHRMEAGTYGSSVKDVLFQVINGHYQFTCVVNGQIYSSPESINIEAANEVLFQNKDIVPEALVFYNPTKTLPSSWVWSQPTIAKIGDFVFAR